MQTASTYRVYYWAHEWRVDSRYVVELAQKLGFPVGSALASLEPRQVEAIKKLLDEQPPPSEPSESLVPLNPSPPSDAARRALQIPRDPNL